ncbi:MAG: septum formation initiator family protein [Agathobacter sp.]|nr:septum formation initiator family protein [Agathobacter sp.]
MAGKRKKNGYNAGTKSIIFIVLVFVVVMSIQIFKLKEKADLLAEREENLMQQLTEEMQREEELEELDLYTKSMEYIKDMANRLGLVFENEIIFKESDE